MSMGLTKMGTIACIRALGDKQDSVREAVVEAQVRCEVAAEGVSRPPEKEKNR